MYQSTDSIDYNFFANVLTLSSMTLQLISDYFLEDCIELVKFTPPPSRKKKGKGGRDDDDDDALAAMGAHDAPDDDENCNEICSDQYAPATRATMRTMSEKEISFELIESLLLYIRSLSCPGAVLIFLPGWNLIFMLAKHLQQHSEFGSQFYRILPLHSQIPREDQRRVFEPAPEGVTKVILDKLFTNVMPLSLYRMNLAPKRYAEFVITGSYCILYFRPYLHFRRCTAIINTIKIGRKLFNLCNCASNYKTNCKSTSQNFAVLNTQQYCIPGI